MQAMSLGRCVDLEQVEEPLEPVEVPKPQPRPGEVLLRVSACGV